MASYELQAFQPRSNLHIVSAVDPQGSTLNIGFWIRDPLQLIQWPNIEPQINRQDFLWENTCFEVFIGIQGEDFYREVNLSPSQAWQCYQFEEYRYPEDMPPVSADDIDLVSIQRTHYGLNATLDLCAFLTEHQVKLGDLFIGLSAVVQTSKGIEYFAIQHTSPMPDFHNKRDWLHTF